MKRYNHSLKKNSIELYSSKWKKTNQDFQKSGGFIIFVSSKEVTKLKVKSPNLRTWFPSGDPFGKSK